MTEYITYTALSQAEDAVRAVLDPAREDHARLVKKLDAKLDEGGLTKQQANAIELVKNTIAPARLWGRASDREHAEAACYAILGREAVGVPWFGVDAAQKKLAEIARVVGWSWLDKEWLPEAVEMLDATSKLAFREAITRESILLENHDGLAKAATTASPRTFAKLMEENAGCSVPEVWVSGVEDGLVEKEGRKLIAELEEAGDEGYTTDEVDWKVLDIVEDYGYDEDEYVHDGIQAEIFDREAASTLIAKADAINQTAIESFKLGLLDFVHDNYVAADEEDY